MCVSLSVERFVIYLVVGVSRENITAKYFIVLLRPEFIVPMCKFGPRLGLKKKGNKDEVFQTIGKSDMLRNCR